ncbi:MAG: hypothetical protein RLN81_03850 [Balneolaceae bacterium]
MIENILEFFGYEYSNSDMASFLIYNGIAILLVSSFFFSIKILDKIGVNRIELTYLKPQLKDQGKAYRVPNSEVKYKIELFFMGIGFFLILFGLIVRFFGINFIDYS